MTTLTFLRRSVLALALSAMALSPALAQDGLQYTTTTRFQLESFGAIGRALGKKTLEEKTSVKGAYMRTDADRQSTIFDVPGRRILYLDHKEKEATEMTFDQMAEMVEHSLEQVGAQTESANAEGAENADMSFKLDAEATGEKNKVNGFDAEQMVLTLEVLYDVEGEDADGNVEHVRGKFFALVDMWMTDEINNYEAVQEFQRAYAQEMGTTLQNGGMSGMMEGMQAAFQQEPRLAGTMQKVAEEMKKVEGAPVRTTMYYILTPEDADLDREAVLGGGEKKKKRFSLGGLAKRAMESRGVPVGDENREEAAAVTEQSVLLSVTSEISDARATALDDELFRIPGGYDVKPFEMPNQSNQ